MRQRTISLGIALFLLVVGAAAGHALGSATAPATGPNPVYLPEVDDARVADTPTPTATSTGSPTPTITPTADPRFGVTVTGIDAATAMPALGLSWWYAYGDASPGTVGEPGTQVAQIQLGSDNSTPIPLATIQAAAQAHPGGYWLIGNEPNVPGPTAVSTDYYAQQLQYYATAIKGTDPTAQIVGPNVLNWSDTCSSCSGFTSGISFTVGLRASWANLYGGEPPIDVWSLHSYPITWNQLPMTDPTVVEQQIINMAGYLAGIPADANKPIWLTEFGVLWGFDGIKQVSSGCVQAPACFEPTGPFDTNAVTTYLTTLVPWLQANGAQYRLKRWFLFTTVGAPLGFSTVYPGISLLSGNSLTSFGQLYRQYAFGQSP